jgi:hypothetical protein
MIRLAGFRSLPTKITLVLAVATVAAGVPAIASANHPNAPAPERLTIVAPIAGVGPTSPAQAATAAATCAKYAARAGWANNGYYSGDLVTAAAICVAESAGDPKRITCNNGTTPPPSGDYPGFTCPSNTTSYDRGLWQLNSVNASKVSNACAFNPVCNADRAYHFSQRGTDFEPWSSYDLDVYTPAIDPVQAAVTKLTSGTVTSAELGECLAPTKSAANANVVVVNCGSGGAVQQWLTAGGKLKSGSVCAAIGLSPPDHPNVVLRRCAPTKSQAWSVFGRDELRNAADGQCLTDPNGSLKGGTRVDVTRCANLKDQTWWLP